MFPAQSPRHWGLVGDDPSRPATFVAESDSKRGNTFTPMSNTLAGALAHFLRSRRGSSDDGDDTIARVIASLETSATSNGYSLGDRSVALGRAKHVVAQTLSG